jgi:hypothetical protein
VTASAGPGTYNWVATYNGDAKNNPVTSPCGSEKVVVSGQKLTGRAYGLKATATLLVVPITVARTPDTGPISTTASSSTTTPCVATVNALLLLSAHALCANVTTVAHPSKSTATASVADTTVSAVGLPTVTMRLVQSSSTTTCAGSTGSTTIAYLKVGNTVVVGQNSQPAPNTKVSLGGGISLTLNEQIAFTTPDEGLTVNAVHLEVNALLATLDLVVASSESDIGNCP